AGSAETGWLTSRSCASGGRTIAGASSLMLRQNVLIRPSRSSGSHGPQAGAPTAPQWHRRTTAACKTSRRTLDAERSPGGGIMELPRVNKSVMDLLPAGRTVAQVVRRLGT